jgi:ATP-binding cassette subfamily F protein 3
VLEDALTAYPGTVLLVTHDRHLIRNVSDAIIDVRDGGATWYDGVPEEILTPADPSKVAAAGTSLSRAGTGGERRTADSEAGGGRKTARQASAKARQNTNELRKRVQKLERALEKAEAEVAELQAQLADPDIYDRPEEVHRLATLHDAAKDRAVALMDEWEHAAEELEG